MRMRMTGAVSVVLAVAALAAVGCGDSDDDEGPTASKTEESTSKPAKVGLLHYALTDYTEAELKGMKETLQPAGGSVTLLNANFDSQKQLQQCQDAVTSRRYNVFVLAAAAPPAAEACVRLAKAADIPVIAIETPAGKSLDTFAPQIDGVVGSVVASIPSNTEAVVEVTKLACEGKDPCTIIGEVSSANDPFANDALEGVKKEVPGAKVVASFAGNFDPAQITKQLPPLLAAHPDADAFVTSSDTQAVAAVPVVKDAGVFGKIKLIGGGGSRRGAIATKKGLIDGNYGNWPETMGKIAAKMAIQAANGEPVEPDAVDAYKIGEQLGQPFILTKDNIDEFKAEWGPEQQKD